MDDKSRALSRIPIERHSSIADLEAKLNEGIRSGRTEELREEWQTYCRRQKQPHICGVLKYTRLPAQFRELFDSYGVLSGTLAELAKMPENAKSNPKNIIVNRWLPETDSAHFARLPEYTSLASLDIPGHPVRQAVTPPALEPLRELKKLRTLRINHRALEAPCAEFISTLDSLHTLDISHTGASLYSGDESPTARHIAKMQALKKLAIGVNRLGDEGAHALAQMKNLKMLYAPNTRITDEGVRALSTMNGLVSLYLSDNIGSPGAAEIAKMKDLQHLFVPYCCLGNEGVLALSPLTGLSSLDIRSSRNFDDSITPSTIQAIARMTNLRTLYTSQNGLTNASARELAPLTKLERLDIRSNNLYRAAGARAIAKLENLRVLDIGDNQLGSAVEELASLQHLEAIYISPFTTKDSNYRRIRRLFKHVERVEHQKKLPLEYSIVTC